jgi:outer membrane receptor protein involved in Fe transport
VRSLLLLAVACVVGPITAWAQATPTAPEEEAPAGAADEGTGAAKGGPPAKPPSDVEVIRIKGHTVTGIQTEVPTSVTQFSASELQALGAQNVSDLAKVTPNVEIKTSGSTAPTFFIRGVGLSDFSANASGAVAIYRDEVAINAPAIQLTPLFDLENVEVLRGPQGTGSGRNASAGAIKIYSRKPTGDLSAELRSTYGNYNFADFEGAVEAPVVDEVVAARLAFRVSQRDGYGDNRCGGVGLPSLEQVPYTGPDDPRLPALPPGGLDSLGAPKIGEQFRKICNESKSKGLNDNTRNRLNPRYTPPAAKNTIGSAAGKTAIPNRDAQGDPQLIGISRLFDGHAEEVDVNDLGNWAARGVVRFDPPWVDDMEWLLNVHGTRIDQLSTLGQAMGTQNGRLGGQTGTGIGYQEQDQLAQLTRITAARRKAQGLPPDPTAGPTENDFKKLAQRLVRHQDDNPWGGDYNSTGQTTLDNWGAALNGNWTLGPVTLTSTSGYERYWRNRVTDQDFTPETYFESASSDDAWQYFQEVKAHGELAETPLRWDLGAYYLMENLNFTDSTAINLTGLATDRTYTQDLWSYAVYAGFAWDFLDDFTVEGGVRWNWDQKNLDFTVVGLGGSSNRTVTSLVDQAPTGGLTLTYRFNEAVSSYWKYSHGWKPGTFNTVAQTCSVLQQSCGVTSAEPETIDAWETGLRGTWFDGALTIGSALFFYKYANYQVFVVKDSFAAPPTFTIVNANDAQVYGAELDLRVEPLLDLVPPVLEGLVINARAGWLESQFLDFTNTVTRPGAVPGSTIEVEVDASGNQLINSPRFKVSTSAEWPFDLGRWGAVIPRYDVAWSSDIFFDPYEGRGTPNNSGGTFLPKYSTGQRRYWIHNVRLGYRVPEGNIEIAGWCHNVTNEVYKTYGFDATTFSGVLLNFVGEPRTYGLDFTVRF